MLSPKPVDNFVGKLGVCDNNPPHPFNFFTLHKKCAVNLYIKNQLLKRKLNNLQDI